jgi:hypothetical protein
VGPGVVVWRRDLERGVRGRASYSKVGVLVAGPQPIHDGPRVTDGKRRTKKARSVTGAQTANLFTLSATEINGNVGYIRPSIIVLNG